MLQQSFKAEASKDRFDCFITTEITSNYGSFLAKEMSACH